VLFQFQRAQHRREPGGWHPAQTDSGERTALVSCPQCGERFSLRKYAVLESGSVGPAVVCPAECGFERWSVLEGWAPETEVPECPAPSAS